MNIYPDWLMIGSGAAPAGNPAVAIVASFAKQVVAISSAAYLREGVGPVMVQCAPVLAAYPALAVPAYVIRSTVRMSALTRITDKYPVSIQAHYEE